MKIKSEDYLYEILTKLFGYDLIDKLMSSDVPDELLDKIQYSIKQIEEVKRRDDLKNRNDKNNKENVEEVEEVPIRFPIEHIVNPNIQKNKNKQNYCDYKDFNTINSKRNLKKNNSLDNIGRNIKKVGVKNNNNSSKKEKPFISATSIYGNYFDPPLQRGGNSKLDEYKK